MQQTVFKQTWIFTISFQRKTLWKPPWNYCFVDSVLHEKSKPNKNIILFYKKYSNKKKTKKEKNPARLCRIYGCYGLKRCRYFVFSLPLKCPELRFPLPTESLPNWNVRMQKPFCKSASSSRTAQWLRQDEGQIFLIAIFKAW